MCVDVFHLSTDDIITCLCVLPKKRRCINQSHMLCCPVLVFFCSFVFFRLCVTLKKTNKKNKSSLRPLGVNKPVLVFSLVTFWQLSDVSKANSQSKVNGRSMKCTFSHRRSFGRAPPAVVFPLNTCTQTTAALVMMSQTWRADSFRG